MIRRSIVTNLMLITLQTLAVFGLIYVMTRGGPGNKSQTLPMYMYQQAFKFYQLGYGTAIALVLLLIGGVFSLVYLRLIKLEDADDRGHSRMTVHGDPVRVRPTPVAAAWRLSQVVAGLPGARWSWLAVPRCRSLWLLLASVQPRAAHVRRHHRGRLADNFSGVLNADTMYRPMLNSLDHCPAAPPC